MLRKTILKLTKWDYSRRVKSDEKERLHVDVPLGNRSYRIEIGNGLVGEVGHYIRTLDDVSKVAIVTDSVVEIMYGEALCNGLYDAKVKYNLHVVPSGEQSKSLACASELWDWVLALRLDRKSLLVALGGGVVGDLTGFIAGTYERGIRFLQVPTTLLAQVDSSVGGKTAINIPGGKNMVGVFHQPVGVLVDPQTLLTLDDDQYKAGLGEVLKYGLSLDDSFYSFLEENTAGLQCRNLSVLRQIIVRCCQIKADIVHADEQETRGFRTLLNYGHTFAHAMETAAGYGTILHGLAVALGSIYSVRLANHLRKRGVHEFDAINDNLIARQVELFHNLGIPSSVKDIPALRNIPASVIIKEMEKDKKTERNQRCFVLPTALGHCIQFRDVDLAIVQELLEAE
ncbi:MAG: 3-dehydroquinate synthase [Planctomycetia bacterium]|nr:3-dehydroquinate synthase [Planctomycetia bacterium]